MNYFELSVTERMRLDDYASWFIELIQSAAVAQGRPFLDSELWILGHTIADFSEPMRDDVVNVHNRAVILSRMLIREQVAAGISSVQVRPGLWVPEEFESRYEALYLSEHPWFICAVLQSTFLGNPLDGESANWTPNNRPRNSRATSTPGSTSSRLVGTKAVLSPLRQANRFLLISSSIYVITLFFLAVALLGQNWVYYAESFNFPDADASAIFWNGFLLIALLISLGSLVNILIALMLFSKKAIEKSRTLTGSSLQSLDRISGIVWFLPMVNLVTSFVLVTKFLKFSGIVIHRGMKFSIAAVYFFQAAAVALIVQGLRYDLDSWVGSRWATMWWIFATLCQIASISFVPYVTRRISASLED